MRGKQFFWMEPVWKLFIFIFMTWWCCNHFHNAFVATTAIKSSIHKLWDLFSFVSILIFIVLAFAFILRFRISELKWNVFKMSAETNDNGVIEWFCFFLIFTNRNKENFGLTVRSHFQASCFTLLKTFLLNQTLWFQVPSKSFVTSASYFSLTFYCVGVDVNFALQARKPKNGTWRKNVNKKFA